MCIAYSRDNCCLLILPKLALVDAEARTQIAKANAETRDAIRERDALKQLLHETQLAEKSLKEEIGAWKAAVRCASLCAHNASDINELAADRKGRNHGTHPYS